MTFKNITDIEKAIKAMRAIIAKRRASDTSNMRTGQLNMAEQHLTNAFNSMEKADYHYEYLYASYKQALISLKSAKMNLKGALIKV